MRKAALALVLLVCGSFANVAHAADPYRWCAEYSGGGQGGSTNCYFVTLEQCRAAISGNGGFCRQNFLYTGDASREPRRRRS